MIWGTNHTERNFDFIIILVAMATERKKTKKYLKIFSSKTTDQILMKHHLKHQCDMGNKRYRMQFWFHHYFGCYGNRKKKPEKKLLKNLLLQNYWPDSYETSSEASVWYGEQMIQNGILIPSLFWLLWQPKEKKWKKILKNLLLQNFWPDFYETSSETSM